MLIQYAYKILVRRPCGTPCAWGQEKQNPQKKKVVVKESDWKTYYGSNTEVKSLPKDELKRYVLMLCKNKKELTYWETKYLFQYNVLEDDRYMNDNILGKFYRKDLISAE